MKKILTLLLIFPLFIACGDDDEDTTPEPDYITNEDIVGYWNQIDGKNHFEFTKNGGLIWRQSLSGQTPSVVGTADFKLTKDIIVLFDFESYGTGPIGLKLTENIYYSIDTDSDPYRYQFGIKIKNRWFSN